METPIGDDDDSHLGDFIEDQATLAPVEAAVYTSLREATKERPLRVRIQGEFKSEVLGEAPREVR